MTLLLIVSFQVVITTFITAFLILHMSFFIFEILRMVAGHGVDKTDEIMETLRFQSFSERTLDDILETLTWAPL